MPVAQFKSIKENKINIVRQIIWHVGIPWQADPDRIDASLQIGWRDIQVHYFNCLVAIPPMPPNTVAVHMKLGMVIRVHSLPRSLAFQDNFERIGHRIRYHVP